MAITTEFKKIATYGVIGVGLTLLTYILWTGFIAAGEGFGYGLLTKEAWVASSQFVASFLVIGLSLYLNRKITFRDHRRRHKSKWMTVVHFYGVYSLGAIFASICTYLLQQVSADIPLEMIKITGLIINVGINYIGQRFWIFD